MTAVHKNENYVVLVGTAEEGYVVVNNETGVREYTDKQISNAISYAESADSFLRLQLWRIIALQAKANAEFLNKQDAEVVFESDMILGGDEGEENE